ncbi:MAG TPA: winged helix-turn-helix domain-containing protein [Vicinamibacteria bacterium]|nr:winged helix-turn-helix domain-containing protein [Vicinamibacteria bacterium]
MLLEFDEYTFDPVAGILLRQGERVPLEPRPARLLACLVERRGELVTRGQLVERLWDAGTHVDFSEGLSYCVRQVRLALGDDARKPRYIETLARRGYRFLPPVERVAAPAGGPRPRARLWAGLALAASLFALVAFVERRPNRHHQLAQRIVGALHEAVWGD